MAWCYSSSTGLTAFTCLVALTVVTVALPYLFSALAQLSYLVSRRCQRHGALLARDLSIAGAAALFSLWVTCASGYQAVYQAMVLVFLGLMAYPLLKAAVNGSAKPPRHTICPPGTARQPCRSQARSCRRAAVRFSPLAPPGPHNGPPLKEPQKKDKQPL